MTEEAVQVTSSSHSANPRVPRVLIFDANVYLNLAKVPGNAPVLRAIEKAVRLGKDFHLVVPEPVKTAVAEHRQEAIEGHWKIRRDALRAIDFISTHISKTTRVVPAPPTGELWPTFKQCPVCGSDNIRPDLIPGPTAFGWGYRQYCPTHNGYVATGEPYDD